MQVNEEDRIAPQAQSNSPANTGWVVTVVLLIAVGAGYYFWSSDDTEPEPHARTEVALPEPAPAQPLVTEANVPEPEVTPAPTPEATPVEAPVAEAPKAEPLPVLNESDSYVHDKVIEIANGMAINALLNDSDMVRQFVVFVDNIAQGQLARKTSPLKAPEQSFSVTDITNKTYLNPDSYHRYDVYAEFLSKLDDKQLLTTYKRLSPLLEQAFAELGYPDMSFDARLREAMQELLATPVIEQPIELYTISVNYQFVDPKLEALPSAQKLLIRMGPDNTRKVKKVLRRLLETMN
ncbi:DUF3014 domain-containing protein [Shewanella avicenniae]|uniref:DUF3014 domain-containing protein n=1 Tax=Shewanella avicenniae TaxID=2814294 RepID=A0ABX7QR35_9GAMM|nr:DUF3014 domain-containing protein [Shewanella avicenniae]QSX33931.1 DUF3014 domain-containing protein [Shewanella avicenniae]